MANPNPSPRTRFKPGIDWTGNPGGRPAGESFTSLLRQALESDHKKDPSWRHNLVAVAIQRAAEGDLEALKWIAEKTEGKVTDKVETSGETRHIIEVRRSRRAINGPDPAGTPPEPTGDRG